MKNKNKIKPEDPKELYDKKQIEIDALLKKIKVKMKEHRKRFKKNSGNWGYVADLYRIIELLKRI